MAVETFVNGANSVFGAGYAACFNTADLNGLAVGASILSTVTAVANDTPSDSYGQLSMNLGSAVFPAGGQGLQFFLFPQNQDGSYGDGASSWSSPAQPNSAYEIEAFIPIIGGATAANKGSSAIFFIPFQLVKFKLAVLNNTGVILAAANSIYLRTMNRQVA